MNLLLMLGTYLVLVSAVKGDNQRNAEEENAFGRLKRSIPVKKAVDSTAKNKVAVRASYIGVDQPNDAPTINKHPDDLKDINDKPNRCKNGRCKGSGSGARKKDENDPYSDKQMRNFVKKLMHVARHFYGEDRGVEDEINESPATAQGAATGINMAAPNKPPSKTIPEYQRTSGKGGSKRRVGLVSPSKGLGAGSGEDYENYQQEKDKNRPIIGGAIGYSPAELNGIGSNPEPPPKSHGGKMWKEEKPGPVYSQGPPPAAKVGKVELNNGAPSGDEDYEDEKFSQCKGPQCRQPQGNGAVGNGGGLVSDNQPGNGHGSGGRGDFQGGAAYLTPETSGSGAGGRGDFQGGGGSSTPETSGSGAGGRGDFQGGGGSSTPETSGSGVGGNGSFQGGGGQAPTNQNAGNGIRSPSEPGNKNVQCRGSHCLRNSGSRGRSRSGSQRTNN